MIHALACNYTLFHAVDSTRLEREATENKKLTLLEKIKVGIDAGALGVVQRMITGIALATFAASFLESDPVYVRYFTFFAGSVGLVDSMMRTAWLGFLQKIMVPSVQRFIVAVLPENWARHRVVQWIASPSGRIAMITAFYAYYFYSCSLGMAGLGSAVAWAVRTVLLPQESILYETTGDLVAPIFSSLVHSFAVWGAQANIFLV